MRIIKYNKIYLYIFNYRGNGEEGGHPYRFWSWAPWILAVVRPWVNQKNVFVMYKSYHGWADKGSFLKQILQISASLCPEGRMIAAHLVSPSVSLILVDSVVNQSVPVASSCCICLSLVLSLSLFHSCSFPFGFSFSFYAHFSLLGLLVNEVFPGTELKREFQSISADTVF